MKEPCLMLQCVGIKLLYPCDYFWRWTSGVIVESTKGEYMGFVFASFFKVLYTFRATLHIDEDF